MSLSKSSKLAAIKEGLFPIIKDNISDEILEYISAMTREEDFDEFVENIVDGSNSEHVRLCNDLKNKLFVSGQAKNENKPQSITVNTPSSSSTLKGKKKFSSFNAHESKSGLRKGRHPCECQATRHELVNNCVKCGRIVCAQEGSGPCLFCDHLVCTRQEQMVLNSQTKNAHRLHNQLMEQKTSKEWKRAVESRNRLLAIDQMGAAKNRVIDDQNDYFDLNSKWNTEIESAELRQRIRSKYEYLHKTPRDFKLALDFASRTATVEDTSATSRKQLLKGVNRLLDSTERRFPKNLFDGSKGQLIGEIVQLMAESSLTHTSPKRGAEDNEDVEEVAFPNPETWLVSDNEFVNAIDLGLCLSVRQPWASLLVAGIKIHEGRSWKTDHRGKLWIAAAAKEAELEDIHACEETYRKFYDIENLEFPKEYPTSCLLGCVYIEDCVDQATYRKFYAEEAEASSAYILICSEAFVLPVFYPIQGQHRIFPLPKELHRTAKAALMAYKWM